jgi:GTPase
MKKDIVAIVGRPNVGKSTLFNRICKKRSAIVDFEEGVTRDRKYEEAEWTGRNFIVVDTGGIIPKSDDRIDKAVKFQAEVAIEESDLILFLVDTKVGVTKIDSTVAQILSPVREKVILVANKTDNEKDDLNIYEFMKLGFGEPFPVAASSGRNIGNFLDVLVEKLKPATFATVDDDSIKIAIVGKPNVGKSSLINRISGKDTAIVTDIPGTTRDSIDLSIMFHEKKLTFIDTAGLRKKKRIKYGVEYFSSMRTIESINRADIVLLILDATEEISTQDQKIISYAARNFKDMILIFNKWDLVEKDNAVIGKYMNKIKDELPFVQYSPAMFVSALTGQRVHTILQKIIDVEEESKKRIPTSQLNTFLERIVQKFPPSHSSGKHSKIYFCTQVKTHPPTFVYFCNDKKLITVSYRRYIHNQMRETFKFEGATLRIFYRGKEK